MQLPIKRYFHPLCFFCGLILLFSLIAYRLSFIASPVSAQTPTPAPILFGTDPTTGDFVIKQAGQIRMRIDSTGSMQAPFKYAPSGDNLLLNGDFEADTNNDGSPDNWTPHFDDRCNGVSCPSGGTIITSTTSDQIRGGSKALITTTTGTDNGVSVASDPFPVKPGTVYTAAAEVSSDTTFTYGFYFRILFYSPDGPVSRNDTSMSTDLQSNYQTNYSGTILDSYSNPKGEFSVPIGRACSGGTKPCTRARLVLYHWGGGTGSRFFDNVVVKPRDLSGMLNASNVTSGTFGASAGGGNFSFPGFLGVGTNFPNYALDVQGADGRVNALAGFFWNGQSLDQRYLAAGSASDFVRKIGDTMTGSLIFSGVASDITTTSGEHLALMPGGTGKVGVGTTNPQQTLHVWGNTRFGDPTTASTYIGSTLTDTGNFVIWHNAVSGKQVSIGQAVPSVTGIGDDLIFSTYNGTTWAEKMRLTTAGNVGINTTTPGSGASFDSTKLDVNGSMHISRQGSKIYFGDVTSGNPLSIGEGTQAQNGTDVDYMVIEPRNRLVIQSSAYALKVGVGYNDAAQTAALAINGNVGIGTTGPGYKLDVQGGQINTSNGFCIAGDCKTAWNQITGHWTANGNHIYNINTANVGIGTSTPGNRLEVVALGTTGNDSIRLTTGNPDGGLRLNNTTAGGAEWFLDSAGTGTGYIAGNLHFVRTIGSVPVMSLSADKVGLGVTNPGVRLDVNGAIRASQGISVDGSTIATANYVYFANGAYVANTGNLVLNPPTGGYVRLNGNVGIGTSPSYALDVNGQIKSSNDIYAYKGVGTINFNAGSSGSNAVQYGYNATSGYGFIQTYSGGNFGGNLAIQNNGGNVGIGTTVPGYKLDVQSGQINASGGLCIAGVCKTNWNEVGGYWSKTGSNIYPTTITDNIGIGTTGPLTRLDARSPNTYTTATNTNIAFFGSNDATGPLGIVVQHSAAGSRYHTGLVGTRYGVSGNDIDINRDDGGTGGMTVQYQGNVGIGTTVPGAVLDIGGGGTLKIGTSWQIGTGGTVTNSSGVYVSSASWAANDLRSRSGNIYLGSSDTHAVAGITSAYLTLNPSGLFASGVNTPYNFRVEGTSTFTGSVNFGGNGIWRNDGYLGVGTTGPSQKFVVSGGNGYIWYDGTAVSDTNLTGLLISNSGSGNDYRALRVVTGSGATEGLTVTNAGRVGIGVSTPNTNYKLDVQGGQINTSTGLCINGDCKTAWNQVGGYWALTNNNLYPINLAYGISLGSATRDSTAILDLTSTTLGFLAPRMTTAQRNLILNPATGLMVYNTTTNLYNVYNGTAWTTVGGVTGGGTLNYLAKWTPDGSTLGNSVIFDNGTNVGIGTTGPVGKLDVNTGNNTSLHISDTGTGAGDCETFNTCARLSGNIHAQVKLEGRGGGGYAAGGLRLSFDPSGTNYGRLYTTGAQPLGLGTNGSDVITILSGGNVGIGTTVPGYKLEVNGNIRAGNANTSALLVNASGTASTQAAIAIQQIYPEGWTAIFADYEPYAGWGLYHDNPANYFRITAEGATGGIDSFSVTSRTAGVRTAYTKHLFDQNNGNFTAGGTINAVGGLQWNGQSLDSRYMPYGGINADTYVNLRVIRNNWNGDGMYIGYGRGEAIRFYNSYTEVARFNQGNQTFDVYGNQYISGSLGIGITGPGSSLDLTSGTWNGTGATARINAGYITGYAGQKIYARDQLWSAVTSKFPGQGVSIIIVYWNGSTNNLDTFCQNSINPGWRFAAVAKGNYFSQAFDGSDFYSYGTVITDQATFDAYRTQGTQWHVACTTNGATGNDVTFPGTGVWKASGSVGIGISDPGSYKLNVQGQINTSGASPGLCISGSCITNWSQAGGSWTLSGNNLYPNSTAYNVALGSATANEKLDVTGNAKVSGVLYGPTRISAASMGIAASDAIAQSNIPARANSFYVAGDIKVGFNIVGNAADVAEKIEVVDVIPAKAGIQKDGIPDQVRDDKYYEPGDVMVLAGNMKITRSYKAYDKTVVGVVSSNPLMIMADSRKGAPIAMTGTVPVKVIGPVAIGDLLTTSDIAGYAMSCNPALSNSNSEKVRGAGCDGAIIGKAMENLEKDKGVINMLVMMK